MRNFWQESKLAGALKGREHIFGTFSAGEFGYFYQKLRIWLSSLGSFAALIRTSVKSILTHSNSSRPAPIPESTSPPEVSANAAPEAHASSCSSSTETD